MGLVKGSLTNATLLLASLSQSSLLYESVSSDHNSLLLEDSGYLLLESGDRLILE